VDDTPAFSSTAEALGTLRAAMSFLAAADATAMPAAVQAQCLQVLEEGVHDSFVGDDLARLFGLRV